MSGPQNSTQRNHYGSFLLAATVYVVGILLFLFWSYSANRSVLIHYTDKSLEDAAFATQEILAIDATTNLPVSELSEKYKRLTRMAQHSNYSSIGAVALQHNFITTLVTTVSDTNTTQMYDDKPLPEKIQRELKKLAHAAKNDTVMVTVKGPIERSLRYAIYYKASGPEHGLAFLVAQKDSILQAQLAQQIGRLSIAGLSMLLLAIPLILLFSKTRKKTAAELSEMNIRLQHDVELQKNRAAELRDAISDLERFNAVTAGRESRIIELKEEINALLVQQNRETRYNIKQTD